MLPISVSKSSCTPNHVSIYKSAAVPTPRLNMTSSLNGHHLVLSSAMACDPVRVHQKTGQNRDILTAVLLSGASLRTVIATLSC